MLLSKINLWDEQTVLCVLSLLIQRMSQCLFVRGLVAKSVVEPNNTLSSPSLFEHLVSQYFLRLLITKEVDAQPRSVSVSSSSVDNGKKSRLGLSVDLVRRLQHQSLR